MDASLIARAARRLGAWLQSNVEAAACSADPVLTSGSDEAGEIGNSVSTYI